MEGGLILPAPQLSTHCQTAPVLSSLVGLIQKHSYADFNYMEVNETISLSLALSLSRSLSLSPSS